MKLIAYKKLKGYKYQTVGATEFDTPIKPSSKIGNGYITLYPNGKMEIADGYCWDGPSGPTLDRRENMRGSLAHDALYQLMRCGALSSHYRNMADEYFIKICREDGMWAITGWFDYNALRLFGSRAATATIEAEQQEEVFTAP